MTARRRVPLDPDLYASVVEEAKHRFTVWPSAYASGWVVKTYKERGGEYAGQARGQDTGLTKWFGEEWVDLSRPIHDDDGNLVGYEPCGRKSSDDPADYPKCRPAREAMRMSKEEVADAVRRKRRAEASAPARGSRARSPTRVATYRENPTSETEIRKLRTAVEAEIEQSGMSGDCETESEIWAKHLRAQGLKVEHHVGVWQSADNIVDHHWLVVDGDLFDPTAWQFKALEGVEADEGEYISDHLRSNPRKPPPLTERELEDLPRANAFWMDFEIENGPEYLPAAMQDAQWPADPADVELARVVLAFFYRTAPGNY